MTLATLRDVHLGGVKRRAALALFAVSLTSLSACVTKVEVVSPSTADPGANSTTTRAPETTALNESPVSPQSPATIRRLQDPSIEQGYFRALENVEYPDDIAPSGLWQVALDACAYFDTGQSLIDWIRDTGLANDGVVDASDKAFIDVTIVAVAAVCPEHEAVINDFAQGLGEADAGQVTP